MITELNTQEINDLLRVSTLTLCTIGSGGEAHAAPVYFSTTGEPVVFYFFSDKNSQHGQDILRKPQAAAALYPSVESWQEIRGLQIKGDVHPVFPGAEWQAAWETYQTKFPFVVTLKPIVTQSQLFVLDPFWIRLVDNRIGFGYKKEWNRK